MLMMIDKRLDRMPRCTLFLRAGMSDWDETGNDSKDEWKSVSHMRLFVEFA
jgi:hypothetical protein